jgi:hypothetical protein
MVVAAIPQSAIGKSESRRFELVESHLRTLELVRTIVVATAGDELEEAHFLHSGIISLVVRLVERGRRWKRFGCTVRIRPSVFGQSRCRDEL